MIFFLVYTVQAGMWKPIKACIDWDVNATYPTGRNPFAASGVTLRYEDGTSSRVNDYCYSSTKVMEYICATTYRGVNAKPVAITCYSGTSCVSGACRSR